MIWNSARTFKIFLMKLFPNLLGGNGRVGHDDTLLMRLFAAAASVNTTQNASYNTSNLKRKLKRLIVNKSRNCKIESKIENGNCQDIIFNIHFNDQNFKLLNEL